ncbi:MAG: 16S rRNA (cytidine(1402)-2'-O)-methyltransferase [Akkermansiaceae bacterium]
MLTFVPTPIGNLGDITLRAIKTLREADLIACEDTRHSLKLLNHLEIAKPLTALHDHNEDRRIPELLEKAAAGEKIAIISDAGTPCLSDPGHRLLKAARDAEVPFTVLPGPSAITTALVASGFPPHPFSFHGFLPVKKGKRRKQLQAALDSPETTLFFESPHRLPSTLEILAELSPETRIGIARELTKTFETLHHGTCAELNAHFSERKAKGEIVLLIPPTS